MSLPIVAIVGRPNVGKSSLLNALAQERISIVDPRAGITRDRVSTILENAGRYFELIDTGGIGMVDEHRLEADVDHQIETAIRRASLILFVVDAHSGITPLDQTVAERLRPLGLPVILVVNKVDVPSHETLSAEFRRFGYGEPVTVSALHSSGRTELLERIDTYLKDLPSEPPEAPVMKLAIVGKRNAGKSTLVNALAGEPRMIVSEIPGTTRDAVDVEFSRDGRRFIAIDTAGVRKKSSMNDIDFYSYVRAQRSIERADVVIHLIDSSVPISEVDLKLADLVRQMHKPCVITVNKWDIAKGKAGTDEYADYITRVMPIYPFAPLTFITAKEGRNVQATVDVALSLHNQAQTRVSTSKLNRALEAVIALRDPSPKHGTKAIRMYYATQVDVAPPTVVFSCNNADQITENYRRFMENRLRELLPFREIPIRMLFRSHHGRDESESKQRSARAATDGANAAGTKRAGSKTRSNDAGTKPSNARAAGTKGSKPRASSPQAARTRSSQSTKPRASKGPPKKPSSKRR
ncbi:MAG: ribosome biogenesis GTPase Der [Phycisphaerae bacterium]|nr:ribosome biogenesis GTPase Der [Phycisphaerae bacterium]